MTCGDAGTECTNQDYCSGSGSCTDNGYQSSGSACGSSSDTDCDNPYSCDGAGGCQPNNFSFNDTAAAEIYTLSIHDALPISGVCNDNGYQSAGTACGSSSDTDCDNPD